MTGSPTDELVQAQLAQLMGSLDVCAAEWDDATLFRFIRAQAEHSLETIEADADEYLDFMSECAILAADNMQDARISFLERQFARAQNPGFDLTDALWAAALVLVGELVIAGSAGWAAPAVVALSFRLGLIRRARNVSTLRAMDAERVLLEQSAAHRQQAQDLIRAHSNKIGTDTFAAPAGDIQSAIRASVTALEQARVAAAAAATSPNLYDRVLQAGPPTLTGPADPRLVPLWKGLRDTAIGRAAETTGEGLRDLVGQGLPAGPAGPAAPFKTSGQVGELLSVIAAERQAARREWRDQRLHLRAIPDASLGTSFRVMDLMVLSALSQSEPSTPSTLTKEQRDLFVLGFELLLWHLWVAEAGMRGSLGFIIHDAGLSWLGAEPGKVYGHQLVLHVDENPDPDPYAERRGHLDSLSLPPPPRRTVILGLQWPGALELSDEQAKYLFNSFARAHFLRSPQYSPFNSQDLPEQARRPFEASRYDEIWRMAEKNAIGWPDGERKTRLDELKILVIDYFSRDDLPEMSGAIGSKEAKQIRDAIRGSLSLRPQQNPLQDLLRQIHEMPGAASTDGPVPLSGDPGAAAGLAELGQALAASGMQQTWRADAAPTRLAAAVTDLDLQITRYEAAAAVGYGADATPHDPAPDLDGITALQAQVQAEYDTLLTLAATDPPSIDPQIVTVVQAEFAERVGTLTGWSAPVPPSLPTVAWRWYGDPPEDSSRPTSTTR